jgi:PD-(D/E)XK nuclease superfamily
MPGEMRGRTGLSLWQSPPGPMAPGCRSPVGRPTSRGGLRSRILDSGESDGTKGPMRDIFRISGKNLGSLAMPDHCQRCFWLRQHAPEGIPYQIFPGIFSSIDSFTKKVVHGWFDDYGSPPPWLEPLDVTGYREPPSHHRFRMRHTGTGMLLTGAPDAVFDRRDGTLLIADYKTARFTENQDALLPIYRVQLNAYATIAEALGWPPVSGLSLIYTEPRTEPGDAADAGMEDGFAMSFTATLKPLELELHRIEPLLVEAHRLAALDTPPPRRDGCRDCARLDGLLAMLDGTRGPD